MRLFHLALGLSSCGFPMKLTRLTSSLTLSGSLPSALAASFSHSRTWSQTRSLTALWIGTTTGMSPAVGLRSLRSSAVKKDIGEG